MSVGRKRKFPIPQAFIPVGKKAKQKTNRVRYRRAMLKKAEMAERRDAKALEKSSEQISRYAARRETENSTALRRINHIAKNPSRLGIDFLRKILGLNTLRAETRVLAAKTLLAIEAPDNFVKPAPRRPAGRPKRPVAETSKQ